MTLNKELRYNLECSLISRAAVDDPNVESECLGCRFQETLVVPQQAYALPTATR
jgi:hypothetical protein